MNNENITPWASVRTPTPKTKPRPASLMQLTNSNSLHLALGVPGPPSPAHSEFRKAPRFLTHNSPSAPHGTPMSPPLTPKWREAKEAQGTGDGSAKGSAPMVRSPESDPGACSAPPRAPATPSHALGTPSPSSTLRPAAPCAFTTPPAAAKANVQLPTPRSTPQPAPQLPLPAAHPLFRYPLDATFASLYAVHDVLGSGGFGFVVRCEPRSDERLSAESVAVKFIEKAKIPSHGWARTTNARFEHIRVEHSSSEGGEMRGKGKGKGTNESQGDAQATSRNTNPSDTPHCPPPRPRTTRLVPMEAYILSHIEHPGVIGYRDLFEDAKYFYLVMEFHGSRWSVDNADESAEVPTQPQTPQPLNSPGVGAAQSFAQQMNAPGGQSAGSPGAPTVSATLTIPPFGSPPSIPPLCSPPPARSTSTDLFECIEHHNHFPEHLARHIFAQLVGVVAHLHRLGICHRDLKDENIVVTRDLHIKLIDFGSAVVFNPRDPPSYQKFYGTTSFAPPEILHGHAYDGPSAEIWSLGVLLHILVTGEAPFADTHAAKAGRISPTRAPLVLSNALMHLIRGCLEVDVGRRFSLGDIARHPWMGERFASERLPSEARDQ